MYTNTNGSGIDMKTLFIFSFLSLCTFYSPVNSKEMPENKVSVTVYYEVHCPGCINFDRNPLYEVILKLSDYINITTFPYGKAHTHIAKDGTMTFECQHGEKECYGNKLHACSLDIIRPYPKQFLFNICMMEPRGGNKGSDDVAADKCGASMSIDPEPIKSCAKSAKGAQLLKLAGEATKKANAHFFPHVLVNNKVFDTPKGGSLLAFVCKQLKKPPPNCN